MTIAPTIPAAEPAPAVEPAPAAEPAHACLRCGRPVPLAVSLCPACNPAETFVRTPSIPARGSRTVAQHVTTLGPATRPLAVDRSR